MLESLEQNGSCPECGKLIWESLPERRRGTPFQRSPSFLSWIRTVVQVHVAPRAVWRDLRVVHPMHSLLLILANCAVAMLIFFVLIRSLAGPGTALGVSGRSGWGWLPLIALGSGVFLFMLTLIEARGVSFFSKRRHWRVPIDLSLAICAHAAATWWIACAGVVAGLLLGVQIENALSSFTSGNSVFAALVPTSGPLLGFILGMLVFETLVYIGVRECKFANRPKSEAA